MSFESGSMTFRMFYLPQLLPKNHVERFAAHAAPPITTLGDDPIHGWVTGRHLLDTNINKDTAYYAGYLRMTMMRAEKKIPESLLRAECRMEELARMQAENRAELDRKTRREIRQEISARLLPTMPPQLKGMALVHLPESMSCSAKPPPTSNWTPWRPVSVRRWGLASSRCPPNMPPPAA